ncbi:MAG: hypothetical protein CMK07_03475 [Ponticaulis sp.]|nr:hypothetical protein [Ponticaulis sp.]
MPKQDLQANLNVFETRLASLERILDKAKTELLSSTYLEADLLSARLAADMLPFPYQIIFTCNQPNQLMAWLKDESLPDPEIDPAAASFEELVNHLQKTRQDLTETRKTAEQTLLDRDKLIQLPNDLSFTLSGHDYVSEWLMPNFYFHFVTTYDILRAEGLGIGKADYMQHLMPVIVAQQART